MITLEEATQLLNKDWSNIHKIKNPSEEIQLIAVQINCRAIDYINNPTKLILSQPNVSEYLRIKAEKKASFDKIPEFDNSEKRGWW